MSLFGFIFVCFIGLLVSSLGRSESFLPPVKDNWAVIVSTSRYWFNYRHLSNALTIYQIIKKMGIPDSQIILINALDVTNDARNVRRGEIHSADSVSDDGSNLLENVEVDFSGDEVTVELFSRLLLNRLPSSISRGKHLLTSKDSNLLIFMSGHGGDEFFKFHDSEELSAQTVGDIFQQMHIEQRYRSILLILETCQASTMANYINVPNVVTLASSVKGQNSYAYTTGLEIVGVSSVDRFTHLLSVYFKQTLLQVDVKQLAHDINANNITEDNKRNTMIQQHYKALLTPSLQSLFNFLSPSFLYSTPCIKHSSVDTTSRSKKGSGDTSICGNDGGNLKLLEYFANYERIESMCTDITFNSNTPPQLEAPQLHATPSIPDETKTCEVNTGGNNTCSEDRSQHNSEETADTGHTDNLLKRVRRQRVALLASVSD